MEISKYKIQTTIILLQDVEKLLYSLLLTTLNIQATNHEEIKTILFWKWWDSFFEAPCRMIIHDCYPSHHWNIPSQNIDWHCTAVAVCLSVIQCLLLSDIRNSSIIDFSILDCCCGTVSNASEQNSYHPYPLIYDIVLTFLCFRLWTVFSDIESTAIDERGIVIPWLSIHFIWVTGSMPSNLSIILCWSGHFSPQLGEFRLLHPMSRPSTIHVTTPSDKNQAQSLQSPRDRSND